MENEKYRNGFDELVSFEEGVREGLVGAIIGWGALFTLIWIIKKILKHLIKKGE